MEGKKWLDGWITTEKPKRCYQGRGEVVVFHSLASAKNYLSLAVTSEGLAAYKQRVWREYWNNEEGNFVPSSLRKVLLQMKRPEAIKHFFGRLSQRLSRLLVFGPPCTRRVM